jgi:arylsulfotransferase ASST
MRLARALAILAVVSCALASSAMACSSSSNGSSHPEGGASDVVAKEGGPADATKEATGSGEAAIDGGTPSLIELSVSGPSPDDASPPITLFPPFSSTIYDYYVTCAAGKNSLTVSMKASPGSSTLLLQPTPSAARPTQTLSVDVYENQAIVAAAADGTATTSYWVRCLPHDFPGLEWLTYPKAGTPSPGYYLVGNLYASTSASYAMILDSHGVPVWYVQAGAPSTGVSDVDSLTDGSVSFAVRVPVPQNENFQLIQLFPLSASTVNPSGAITDNHELRLLTNGDYVIISTPLVSGVNLDGMVIPLPDGGTQTLSGPQTIVACNIVEFQPFGVDGGLDGGADGGTVVWSWSAMSHFDPLTASTSPIFQSPGSPIVDPFHCNSIDVESNDPNGNLLVSSRQMNSVFYVQKSGGTVLWKMGGSDASIDDAKYVTVASPFYGQHDARFLAGWSPACNGGSGQISVFDDQTYGPGPARGAIYDIIVGNGDAGIVPCEGGAPEGGAPGTATLAWQYSAPSMLTAAATGSMRVQSDDARVIGWGIYGKPPHLVFSEVDSKGNDMLDLNFKGDNISYRAIKVPLTAFDLDTLRATAGLPLP